MVVVSGAEAKTEPMIPIEGEEGTNTMNVTADATRGQERGNGNVARDRGRGAETGGEMTTMSLRRGAITENEAVLLTLVTIVEKVMTSMIDLSEDDNSST